MSSSSNISKEDKEILDMAKERYEIASSAWGDFYRESREILKFIYGDQWNYQLRQNRENAGLPCLTVNSLPTFLRQITNEARQNTPAIQIDPKDDQASQDNAEIFADLIRGIEQQSNAATAYDQAAWYAAAIGLGFMRIISEYDGSDSFEQKLVIKAVEDPETILIDPSHRNLDGSDAEWCFIVSTITKDEYLRQFLNSNLAREFEEHGWTSNYSNWIKEHEIVIAEYYWKDYEKATLYEILDVTTNNTYRTENKPAQEFLDAGLVIITQTRTIQKPIIKWAKLNDVEILEQTTWPGTTIPVVTVKGDELWLSGKRKLKGAVFDALDSQRALNYFFSESAQLVSLAPKAPFIGEIRQFNNFEHLWRDANIATSAYLPYNAVTENGSPLPPPMRQTFEAPIQAAMTLVGQARENLKAIFGIFDASLGAHGNETSGIAILSRQKQSHTSTYHYYDNLVKAIQQIGRILVENIPIFYADERIVQLIKRNGEASTASINGENDQHSLTNGKYGVVVETGPSYTTRRQESVEAMTTLGGVYPQAMPLIADIIASESDWPGSKQVADRLRLALPPEIQQAEAANGKLTTAQQAAMSMSQVKNLTAQLQQAQQMIQIGHQEVVNLTEENKLLKTKSAVDLEKATMDKDYKDKQLILDELTTELEYKVKMRELTIQEAELKLEEAKLAIVGVQAAHKVSEDMHDRHNEHEAHIRFNHTEPISGNIGGKI